MSKCPMKDAAMRGQVAQILQPREANQGHDVALMISERFLNMPVQIMPPMYKMLMDEMTKVRARAGIKIRKTMPGLSRVITLLDRELTRYYSLQNVGFNFEWYVFISKTYKEVQSTLDEEEEQNAPVIQVKKKAKKVCSLGNLSAKIHNPRLTTCFSTLLSYLLQWKCCIFNLRTRSLLRMLTSNMTTNSPTLTKKRRQMLEEHSQITELLPVEKL